MNPEAMTPHGLALAAFLAGDTTAELVVRREDGVEDRLPVSWSFRSAAEFTPIENAALECCRGHVLDIGAGSGIHALALQSRGLAVTAIDVDPQSVEVMIRRGVEDVRVADIFEFQGGPFDTLLMLGHGIGIVENLRGLAAFLKRAQRLASSGGQLLIHSIDVQRTDDPRHLAYHEAARQAGRYPGEVRMELEFMGRRGSPCGWLHVAPRILAENAERVGWGCETLVEQESGEYLSRLTPTGSPSR